MGNRSSPLFYLVADSSLFTVIIDDNVGVIPSDLVAEIVIGQPSVRIRRQLGDVFKANEGRSLECFVLLLTQLAQIQIDNIRRNRAVSVVLHCCDIYTCIVESCRIAGDVELIFLLGSSRTSLFQECHLRLVINQSTVRSVQRALITAVLVLQVFGGCLGIYGFVLIERNIPSRMFFTVGLPANPFKSHALFRRDSVCASVPDDTRIILVLDQVLQICIRISLVIALRKVALTDLVLTACLGLEVVTDRHAAFGIGIVRDIVIRHEYGKLRCDAKEIIIINGICHTGYRCIIRELVQCAVRLLRRRSDQKLHIGHCFVVAEVTHVCRRAGAEHLSRRKSGRKHRRNRQKRRGHTAQQAFCHRFSFFHIVSPLHHDKAFQKVYK